LDPTGAASSTSTPLTPEGPSPKGSVFISYRASDGKSIARACARILRAHGVPVWLDATDLPPGEIGRRLDEALASGLSGGVLIVTPEVSNSTTIRMLEAPRLLDLAADSSFSLAVVNAVTKFGSTDLDRLAPQTLLAIDSKGLGDLKQYAFNDEPQSSEGIHELGRWMALRRLRIVRGGREHEPFVIDIQSRESASARAADGDLVFRTVPPADGRLPDQEVWDDLRSFLAALGRALADSGTQEVLLRGGSHLSMAFALGAALPRTTPYRVSATATSGAVWTPLDSAPRSLSEQVISPALDLIGRFRRGRPLAVFVDFNEHPEDGAFGRHLLAENRNHRRHCIRNRRHLSDTTGPAAVAKAASRIRRLAAHQATSQVDLFLRAPWPAAVLLGRELNTLRVNLYEWERRGGHGAYAASIAVASGEGAGPIQEILWEEHGDSE